MSCNRCSQSSSTPANFLLLCRSCHKHWHHRCHPPPLKDGELLQLICSQTAGDRDNGLDSWICKRCSKKNQAAETSSKTAAQSLRPKPDDNQQPLPSVQAQASLGLALPKDKGKIDPNVATRGSGTAGPSIETTTHILHTAERTQHNDHGSQHQQQQDNHTGSQMKSLGAEELRSAILRSDCLRFPDNNKLPTTTVKKLQVKRVLQEQHLDGPRADRDYPHRTETCLDQPAVPSKYARAPDGKKVVSSGYPPKVEQLKDENRLNPSHIEKPVATKEDTPPSRSVTLFSERICSPFTSLPVNEEEHIHYDSVVKSPGGNGQEVGTRTDTPSGTPVGHGDIEMKDDSDDLYGPPVPRFSSSTPIPSSSRPSSEQQGGSVMQEGCQTTQQQGVFQSHHQSEGQSRLKQTPKAETQPLLGPDWLKARYSVADDPWCRLCDPQRRMYSVSRRKKPTTKFLGNPVQSVATTDRELLRFFFCRDWIQQTQANI
ncbi:hypothetical protein DFJ58DRAFT_722262 [Suillus subalutaceus]|uniref:uncharacterized protein n=1 Tax=Suillus subalutaceus TaxID=48586 RepID=UPI001B85C527|nr:uncharacterized protein DFJ58DRAFT_722262 [Suillus subalutaceus]KAG1872326.1 hypothetical protein DFJ58DRAFT_722262 [Suillus subalutaceus]